MDHEEDIRRGENARRILEDDLFVEAVETIKQQCFEAWKATSWNETDKREAIHRQFKALGEIETRLRSIMEGGKVAKSMLEKLLRK
jgi:hypothetical protein